MSQATDSRIMSSQSADNPPTPSRRSLLTGSAAALLAGAAAATVARGAPATTAAAAGPDAELIAACDRVVALEAELQAVYAVRHSREDEQRTEPDLDRLYGETEVLMRRIEALPAVTTLAGVAAMARASLALAPLDDNGDWTTDGDAEWLAFTAAEWLAGSAAA